MMKQTIYLVDSENVNDAWVPLLPKLGRRDQVIVFHTKNSPHLTTESASLMADFQNNLTWEKCFTGTNGLDFQLVSRLGYLICKKPRATFVIVSNDTGFDAAIKYWVQEGKQVSRIRGASCSEEAPLAEVQEKIVLEDAPDKQRKRPRKKKKKGQGGQNPSGNGKQAEMSRNSNGNGKQADSSKNPNGKQADSSKNSNGKQADSSKNSNGNGKKAETSRNSNGNGKQTETSRNSNGNGKQEDPSRNLNGNGKQAEAPGNLSGGGEQDGAPGNASQPGGQGQEEAQRNQNQSGNGEQKQQEKSIPVSSVLGICRSVSLSRHEMIHESLVALLGAEDGREVYHFLKDNQEFQNQLKKIYLPDRNARVENYLKVVFDYHKEELKETDQIRSIINKYTAGDRNGIFQAMTEAFGHKRGARYYGILKAHVRVLKKI